jgi:outer membrane lipoprotein SlyB
LALATTVARALLHGGSLTAALWAGCGWMMVFAGVGALIGHIAERTIEEAVAGKLLAEMAAREADGAPRAAKASSVGD